jgi:ribosomal-protein-alanine N-acetyltransferase
MYFETSHLIIRDYEERDFQEYFRLKHNPKTMYYLQDIQLKTEKEAEKEFRGILEDQKSPSRIFYFFHVELKGSHETIGSSGYTVKDFTPVGKLVHAGYFFYPIYWGRGYATESFQRIIQYAFEENGVYRLTTGCLAENIGSEKVMIKCGLIREAEHLDWEWHDGKMKTRLEYRLLKPEWEAMAR